MVHDNLKQANHARKNVNNREGNALEREKNPYILIDTKVLGCMST
jgi:hypothetical protein